MVAVCKLAARAWRPLLIVLVASAALALCSRQRKSGPPTSAVALDDWDIPRLADYLNRKGVPLRLVATQNNGTIRHNAFLTTTDKEWDDLSRPVKDPRWIGRWRGTLYCERNPEGDDLARQWGDCYLEVGPFMFFGDPELLARVRTVLATLVSSEDQLWRRKEEE